MSPSEWRRLPVSAREARETAKAHGLPVFRRALWTPPTWAIVTGVVVGVLAFFYLPELLREQQLEPVPELSQDSVNALVANCAVQGKVAASTPEHREWHCAYPDSLPPHDR